jgi:hypothetical protein
VALLFIDSFDHYSVAQGSRKWTSFSLSSTIVAGRTGNGLQAMPGHMPAKTLNAEYATLTAGVAYKSPGFPNSILQFTNAVNNIQFYLQHVGDGRLQFRFFTAQHAFGGIPARTSSPSAFVMNVNQWYYFEMQATIAGGPPYHVTATARANGVEILSWDYTEASLGAAGAKFATVGLEGGSATVDDFYCTDTEYLGDVKIGVLYPNAAGDLSAWTPLSGANWAQVEEHPADDDTSYVSAASVGLKDLYNLDDISGSFTGTIKGAQALWLVKKSDEGEAAVKGLWKSGATELTQSAGHNYFAPGGFYPSATAYLYDIQTERVSLFTAIDWTTAEINALQIGITRTI